PDSATQVAAFESGEVSQIQIPPHDVTRLVDSKKYQVFHFLRKGVGLFLEFNTVREPFADLKVRRAMNYAIDKDVLVKVALEGQGEPAYGPLPPSIWGYWPGIVDYAPHYDPDIIFVWFDSVNIGAGLNFSHYADRTLDGMIETARRTMDTGRRAAVYADLQRYVVDKALWVPLWTNFNYIALQPSIKEARIH